MELLRPWKLASLLTGIALLIYGAHYYDAPDWDVRFSIIQALETYLVAAWSLRVVLDRQWRWLPLAVFAAWFTVDGSYWIYWSIVDPEALAFMRWANFFASLSLYGMCGVLWLWQGTLRELVVAIRREVA